MKKYIWLIVATSISFALFISCSTESTPIYQLNTLAEPAEAGSVTQSATEAEEGETITITANANEHWVFDRWSGDHTGTTSPSSILMDRDKMVLAMFVKREYPLTINIEGEGTVTEEVIQAKTTDYPHGTVVRLTATPKERWEFTGWSGPVDDQSDVIELEITQPVTVQAAFALSEADFTGRVISSENNEGIALAVLRLQHEGEVYEQITDESGEFAFIGLSPGEYELRIRYPQGYRGVDEIDSTLLLDRNISLDLVAEPVREITTTIQPGQRDTLSTITGAIVDIDLSGSSVEVEVEVTVTENKQLTENEKAVSEPVRVRVGNPSQSKQSAINMQSMGSDQITIKIQQNYNIELDNILFLLDTGLEEESSILYSRGIKNTFIDPFTSKETIVFEHEFTLSAQTSFDITYALTAYDSECEYEDRSLYELTGVLNGDKPLILIHGWQPKKIECDEFKEFTPEHEVFPSFITELQRNPEIFSNYKLYIYKYTSNTPVLSNSEALWQRMNELGLADKKPVLIGHSMGGLVGRGLMAKYGQDAVDGLITLGTPHEGSPMTITAQRLNITAEKACSETPLLVLCKRLQFDTQLVPETAGFLDLDRESSLIQELKQIKGSPEKIYTVAGRLNSVNETESRIYKAGWKLMKPNLKYENDGIVPVESAIPSWSGLKTILEAHDHTMVVTGIDFNASTVFGAIQPVLINLVKSDGRDNTTAVVEVTSATGRIWMDRNLGASRAATSSTDEQAYGDLYQWGRGADGHQKRNSPTTTTYSSSDQPGHGSFILAPNSPFDWRSPRNDNLWQGVNGINNPCPTGYRVPTEAEWNAERLSWSSNNPAGAFASSLKLPLTGHRLGSDGSLDRVDNRGSYWSGSVDGTLAHGLSIRNNNAVIVTDFRAIGATVRCTKN